MTFINPRLLVKRIKVDFSQTLYIIHKNGEKEKKKSVSGVHKIFPPLYNVSQKVEREPFQILI